MAKQKNIEGGLGGTLQIERRSIAELSNDPANARKHNDKNIEAIIASLRRFGQQKPIVIDRNNIVRAGNGTLEAARRLGWDSIDCVKTSLEGSDAIAYAIADNRTAELAEWDDDVLAAQLNGLLTESEEIALAAGWTAEEIEAMVALSEDDPEITEDDVPEPPVDPITKSGDLWILGEHRLLCGDSTKGEDIKKLMAGVRANLCVTDPPYNIDYGNIKHPKFKQRSIANDNMPRDQFRTFCESFVSGIKENVIGCVYVFGPPGPDGRVMFSALDEALHCSTTIVWNKDQFTLGRGKYQNKYEPCWFGWVENGSRFTDDRTLTNVWDFPRPRSSEEHPTMKPVVLIANAISHASMPTDIIYDCFLGSGTTLIAAEQLGRKCYGMEISPQYCDVIVKRWETLTGNKAVLEQ